MAVYVDQPMPWPPSRKWPYPTVTHMFADTREELRAFGHSMGLKDEWLQDHRDLPHYDLTEAMRGRAIREGAVEVTGKDTVAAMRKHRASVSAPAAEGSDDAIL